MPAFSSLIVSQLIGTLGMVGIVLFVHVVQYPMLARVPLPQRAAFEAEYSNRACFIIVPLMLLEAGSAFALYFIGPFAGTQLALVGLVLLSFIWLVTFLHSAPAHERLIKQWDDRLHAKLLISNFVRAAAWCCRAVVVLGMSLRFL